jgi:carboxylesterase
MGEARGDTRSAGSEGASTGEFAVQPGAEPWWSPGGPHGALVVHGFTGNPSSVRGLAEAFAAAGFTVSLPRLPGHGTHPDDVVRTRWPDWLGAVEEAYQTLAAEVDRMVVAGLSMGASLAAVTAARHPEVAGLVVVNGAFDPELAGLVPLLEAELANGETMAAIGSDIAKPGATEASYPITPLRGMISLVEAVRDEVSPALVNVRCPSLVLTSPNDHVVPPASSDHFAAQVSGPVERVVLERSYHVATLDFDAPLVEERAVEFARRVTADR